MFHINRDIFQTSPKLNRYLDNFCCKICKKPFKNSPIWSHWLRVLTTSSIEGFRWIFYWTEKKQILRWPWKFVRMRPSSSFTADAADATSMNEHFSLKYQKLIFSFRVCFCFCFFCFCFFCFCCHNDSAKFKPLVNTISSRYQSLKLVKSKVEKFLIT